MVGRGCAHDAELVSKVVLMTTGAASRSEWVRKAKKVRGTRDVH